MTNERIIKKYPNRRLYDTQISKYITLSDVRDLVMGCVPIKVLDTTSETDITRAILLQIMLEEESGGKPLFSAPMLAQVIRFYGGTVQGVFARYLEGALNLFSKQQEQLAQDWVENPLEAMTRATQRNMELWTQMQQDFIRATGFPVGGEPKTKPEKTDEK